jgi:uncharacterized protein with LGFP repeats
MTGLGTRLGKTIGRAGIAVVAAMAAVLLVAPLAAATPVGDADAAITQAWDVGGGPTGPLGIKDGGVYPIGAGFGQNFAGGKIFFTPETGAHAMSGAILDEYQALGGPADGDLGFPTIDEGAGKAPDSRNTTFSAADNPVIFWTPDTGARVVRGPINAAWDKLDGSAGPLGVPSDDEAYRGNLVTQKFTGGEVTYDRKAKAFTTVPPELAGQLDGLQIPDDPASAINAARRAAGGPLGPLGAAQGEPYKIGADGLGQNFAGGKIFYSPSTGANVVTGQVMAKYESVGGPQGDLGFPTTSEVDGGLATESRMSSFAAKDQPVIFWTPDYGAVIVRGAMNAAWQKLGGATGSLGAPMADQAENGDVITQRFSGGVVSYDRSKKTFSTEPANLAPQLAGLQVPGQEVPKAPPANPQASDTKGHKWFTSSWLWVLAIVPVLILAGLVAFAALRNRRRGREDALVDSDSDGDEFGHGGSEAFGAVPAQGQDAETADDDATEVFSGRNAREGVGSPPATSGPEYSQAPMSLWEPPEHVDEADTTREPVAAQESDDAPQAGHAPDEDQEDPDSVDTAPTRVPTPVERDPLTDTGRHARIEVDEPAPNGTAMHLPLDDPNEAPEGYPVKADTKSGLYWVPGTTLYDDARAEVWFVSEELARTNGFVRAN